MQMTEKIGFIGLGLMGRPMAKNLLKAGYAVVVHSRSQGPVDDVVGAGAERASSPADVARQATRIVTMLPDSPDVELVLEGENGVFSAIQRGTILIDTSSIAPAAARRLAARAKTFGATMLDAPVPAGVLGALQRARLHRIEPFTDRLLARHSHSMIELAQEYVRWRKTFDRMARSTLQHYRWPGNVREMRNVLERLMIMVPGDTISPSDLSFLDGAGSVERRANTVSVPLHEAREAFERDYIRTALAAQQGNISRTADALGVERSNLYRKMKAFGIAPVRRVDEEEEPA